MSEKDAAVKLRWAILRVLIEANRELIAKEIGELVNKEMPEVWSALRYLRAIGLVSEREYADGYWVYKVVRK